jgi:hypothetical protein
MPLLCHVHDTLTLIKELFCHHLPLVVLMEICKVMDEKACPHIFPALSAGNDVGVPLGGQHAPSVHPPV